MAGKADWLVPAGAAAGTLIGGVIGNRSKGKEAEKDRQFQQRMSSTAWQRGVKDMEAAGINPALAYSQGGASSPGGAMAQQDDVMSGAVTSAMNAKRMRQELDNMRSSKRETDARTGKIGMENAVLALQQDQIAALTRGVNLDNTTIELMLPGMRNIAGFESGALGQKTRTTRALIQSIFGGGGLPFKRR